MPAEPLSSPAPVCRIFWPRRRGRILTISPPLDFAPHWLRGHAAYSLAKYGMSFLTAAWAAEFDGRLAFNCLWPRTVIDTAAVRNLLGGAEMAACSRRPEIMADAAHAVLARPQSFTGWFCLDDLILAAEGPGRFRTVRGRSGQGAGTRFLRAGERTPSS